ncbi:MAG TPA: NAD(P)H-dependent oxidoreductase, partial [Pseudorhizobium sp.]|nr:NAD(P)H-dependent oxidoreductase [Pseudorhizobium sp.]
LARRVDRIKRRFDCRPVLQHGLKPPLPQIRFNIRSRVSERACSTLRAAGHDVVHRDLYRDQFEPRLSPDEAYSIGDTLEDALARSTDPVVQQYRDDLRIADGLLVVHPNWWGKPPAILAGWIDRVLVPGVAYRLECADGQPEGLLAIHDALIFNTSDTPADRESEQFGDPLELIWGRCVLPFCGVKRYKREIFRPVVGSPADERIKWLDRVENCVLSVFRAASHT